MDYSALDERRPALEEAMALLTPPPSGGPLENTHMSPFSTDVVISTAGRFQRLDSAKGSVH